MDLALVGAARATSIWFVGCSELTLADRSCA
jgi:hypothetical protein